MNIDLLLSCPECGAAGLAGDTFCEACGAAIAADRDAARHHVEIDAGTAAGVTDRGLVHRRNDDAVHVRAEREWAVLAVCDGVSASTGPDVAAQVAVEELGRCVERGAATARRGAEPCLGPGWSRARRGRPGGRCRRRRPVAGRREPGRTVVHGRAGGVGRPTPDRRVAR